MNFIFLFFLLSCNGPVAQETTHVSAPTSDTIKTVETPPLNLESENRYSWLNNYDSEKAIVNQIFPPDGFKRIKVEQGSFAEWLRFLPLNEEAEVKLYNGQLKGNQTAHHRIVDIDVGTRDLQQCADAVMRLKAEYHYSNNDFKNIHFNYTSGDKVGFDDWAHGKKPRVSGNNVSFTARGSEANFSYRNFKAYLQSIFSYAGTASLEKELQVMNLDQIEIGSTFIKGGFPGHAVIVVDMVENAHGEKYFLLAQSYMPAQQIHILKNPMNTSTSPWYSTNFSGNLETPEWTFSRSSLKRFKK